MSAFFSTIAATFVTMPILAYLMIFIVSKQVTKQHRRAVQISLDGSTLFFIISVHYLILTIWERSLLWLILFIMIFIATLVAIIHWKVKQEINFRKVFRGFWRINFLLFCSAYMILLIFGIIKSISTALA